MKNYQVNYTEFNKNNTVMNNNKLIDSYSLKINSHDKCEIVYRYSYKVLNKTKSKVKIIRVYNDNIISNVKHDTIKLNTEQYNSIMSSFNITSEIEYQNSIEIYFMCLPENLDKVKSQVYNYAFKILIDKIDRYKTFLGSLVVNYENFYDTIT
jgi:hypothetical protein